MKTKRFVGLARFGWLDLHALHSKHTGILWIATCWRGHKNGQGFFFYKRKLKTVVTRSEWCLVVEGVVGVSGDLSSLPVDWVLGIFTGFFVPVQQLSTRVKKGLVWKDRKMAFIVKEPSSDLSPAWFPLFKRCNIFRESFSPLLEGFFPKMLDQILRLLMSVFELTVDTLRNR